MVLAVLAVVIVGLGLIVIKAVPVVVGIALIVVSLFTVVAIGERRDRLRQRGIVDPSSRLDHRRAVIPTGMDALHADDNLDAYADTLVSHRLSDQPRSRSDNAR